MGMKTLREKYLKNRLNNQFYRPIIVSKDDFDKFEEQETKKIILIRKDWFDKLIKQHLMGNKPKIIRDKLKRKKIRVI